MPARLPQLRLDKGRGRLTEAVQKLTGLDELIVLGTFIQGLSHKSRDYLSFKTNELAAAKIEFEREIEAARAALLPVSVIVRGFKPGDTAGATGEMATLGKILNDKASELTNVVSGDLAAGLDLADAQIQRQVGLALASAEKDVAEGLDGFPTWKVLQTVLSALDRTSRLQAANAISAGQQALEVALNFHKKEQDDNRYRLKATAARWHATHSSGEITTCPICAHSLSDSPDLLKELNELKASGEGATRRLADNLNAILVDLEKAVPQVLKRYLSEAISKSPRASLLEDIHAKFVIADRYTKYLAKGGSLVKGACLKAPAGEFVAPPTRLTAITETASVVERLSRIDGLCATAEWFESEKPNWEGWWKDLTV